MELFKGIDVIVASCRGSSDLLGITSLIMECEGYPEVHLVPQLLYHSVDPSLWPAHRSVLFVDYWATSMLGRRVSAIEDFVLKVRKSGHSVLEYKPKRSDGGLSVLGSIIDRAVNSDSCPNGYQTLLASLNSEASERARRAAFWADAVNEDENAIPLAARKKLDSLDFRAVENPHVIVERTLQEFEQQHVPLVT